MRGETPGGGWERASTERRDLIAKAAASRDAKPGTRRCRVSPREAANRRVPSYLDAHRQPPLRASWRGAAVHVYLAGSCGTKHQSKSWRDEFVSCETAPIALHRGVASCDVHMPDAAVLGAVGLHMHGLRSGAGRRSSATANAKARANALFSLPSIAPPANFAYSTALRRPHSLSRHHTSTRYGDRPRLGATCRCHAAATPLLQSALAHRAMAMPPYTMPACLPARLPARRPPINSFTGPAGFDPTHRPYRPSVLGLKLFDSKIRFACDDPRPI